MLLRFLPISFFQMRWFLSNIPNIIGFWSFFCPCQITTVKQLRPKYNPTNQGSMIFYFLSGQGAFEIDDYEKKNTMK